MTPEQIITANNAANPQLLQLAEQLLAKVRSGQVSTLAVLTVSPLGNIDSIAWGLQVAELYVTCDLFKQKLLDTVRGAANRMQRFRG